jgi:hypothetical protein
MVVYEQYNSPHTYSSVDCHVSCCLAKHVSLTMHTFCCSCCCCCCDVSWLQGLWQAAYAGIGAGIGGLAGGLLMERCGGQGLFTAAAAIVAAGGLAGVCIEKAAEAVQAGRGGRGQQMKQD